MNFLEKLDFLMSEKRLNKNRLSQISGVPYTTIDGFYKKGYDNAKISTIKKIASALDVTLDYLVDDVEPTKNAPSEKDEALLDMFHKLNDEGKEQLLDFADSLVRSGKFGEKDSKTKVV